MQKAIELLKGHGYTEEEIRDVTAESETVAKYFGREDGNLTFEANKALEAGLDKEIVSNVKNDIKKINDLNEKESKLNSIKRSGIEMKAANCAGVTTQYGSQGVLLTDNCVTRDIEHDLMIGAVSYTIYGIIVSAILLPAGVAVSIAAVLVGYSSWYVGHMNQGRGIWIFYQRPELVSQ